MPINLVMFRFRAQDLHATNDFSLLLQLADHHGIPADDYIVEVIIRPHIRL